MVSSYKTCFSALGAWARCAYECACRPGKRAIVSSNYSIAWHWCRRKVARKLRTCSNYPIAWHWCRRKVARKLRTCVCVLLCCLFVWLVVLPCWLGIACWFGFLSCFAGLLCCGCLLSCVCLLCCVCLLAQNGGGAQSPDNTRNQKLRSFWLVVNRLIKLMRFLYNTGHRS